MPHHLRNENGGVQTSASFLGAPPTITKPYMRTRLRKGPSLLGQSSWWEQMIWGY